MKTNQIMVREDGFMQRTDDGYFSATKLIDKWNSSSGDGKQLGNYMKNQSTIEYIDHLKKEGILNPVITNRGRGGNAGTWVHPKVFIDLAMWVSVGFKSRVIDYVIDGLIKSRHDAGDYYNEMTRAILEVHLECHGYKPNPSVYISEANFLKSLVAIKDRNNMTESELRQLTYLQKFNTLLIRKKIGKESRTKSIIQASEIRI